MRVQRGNVPAKRNFFTDSSINLPIRPMMQRQPSIREFDFIEHRFMFRSVKIMSVHVHLF